MSERKIKRVAKRTFNEGEKKTKSGARKRLNEE
jgi:hypothetical protein